MRLRGLIDEDIANYKKTSMFLICPFCSFKCDKENNCEVCQNSSLTKEPILDIDNDVIITRFIKNPLTSAFVFGGLEPFDSSEIFDMIKLIRESTNQDIVIYTGYTEDELARGTRTFKENDKKLAKEYEDLVQRQNIIIKYGRFVPNRPPHYDDVLGVSLASDNQYAIAYNLTNS